MGRSREGRLGIGYREVYYIEVDKNTLFLFLTSGDYKY